MEFGMQVPGCSEALPLITAELRRARRYEHRLAAVVMSPESAASETFRRDLTLVDGSDEKPSVLDAIADGARGTLRRAELVTRPLRAISALMGRKDANGSAGTDGDSPPVTLVLANFLRVVQGRA